MTRARDLASLKRRCLALPNPEQKGLFDRPEEIEGFALTSPSARPTERAHEGIGTQETLPGVSRKVSAEALTQIRERKLASRAARKRKRNPERWLAPRLSPEQRARLKDLHDAHFDTFEEIEAVPGAALTTPKGRYVVPEGYALSVELGGVRYLFFQDEAPAETWTFVAVGRRSDRVEHLADYLAVLERIDLLDRRQRRH